MGVLDQNRIKDIKTEIACFQEQILNHNLYQKLDSLENIRCFSESHVFAVWDFMSVVKNLQRNLSCVEKTWRPSSYRDSRRFINEIVLDEESDIYSDGRSMSHFEFYYEAMHDVGASTKEIDILLSTLKSGADIQRILDYPKIGIHKRAFMKDTFAVIDSNKLHQIAAHFTFARESLIPSMFTEILDKFSDDQSCSKLIEYFKRHIEVDDGVHKEHAYKMLHEICQNDDKKWSQVKEVAINSLKSRLLLWNSIEQEIV